MICGENKIWKNSFKGRPEIPARFKQQDQTETAWQRELFAHAVTLVSIHAQSQSRGTLCSTSSATLRSGCAPRQYPNPSDNNPPQWQRTDQSASTTIHSLMGSNVYIGWKLKFIRQTEFVKPNIKTEPGLVKCRNRH